MEGSGREILITLETDLKGVFNLQYEGGLKSKFRFVITFLFFIVHT